MEQSIREKPQQLTLLPHAPLETLLQSAVLALVPVVNIHRTVPTTPAGVGEASAYRPLEEALASLARELAVVLAGALVPADGTVYVEGDLV